MQHRPDVRRHQHNVEKIMKGPNTPGMDLFNRAMKAHCQLYQAEPLEQSRLTIEEFALAEQYDLFLETEEFRKRAVNTFLKSVPTFATDMQVPLTIRIAMQGTTEDTIGMVTITRTPQGHGSYTFTQLLRDPNWMGMDAALPATKDLRAIVFQTTTPGRPGLIVAMDPNTLSTNSPAPFPDGEATVLRNLLAWHGAEPVWSQATLQ